MGLVTGGGFYFNKLEQGRVDSYIERRLTKIELDSQNYIPTQEEQENLKITGEELEKLPKEKKQQLIDAMIAIMITEKKVPVSVKYKNLKGKVKGSILTSLIGLEGEVIVTSDGVGHSRLFPIGSLEEMRIIV